MCYYPDGSNAAEIPCPQPVSSSCCPAESNCLTNGLCWGPGNFLFRGSCRDKSWADPNCPKFCRQYIPSSGKVLAPCNDSGFFTCNYNCTDSNLTVPRGEIILRDYQLSSAVSAFSLPSTFASASSTISSPSTFASTSSTISSPSTSPSTSSTFSSPASTFSNLSFPSSTSTSPPLNLNPDVNCTITSAGHPPAEKSPILAAVAAGVGLPLSLAWLATLVFLGRERRKTRLLEQEKLHLRDSARDCQHAKRSGNAHKLGGESTEMGENRAPRELAAVLLEYELQA